MKAIVVVTAELQNPTEIWEQEIPIEYPDERHEKAAVMQILNGVRAVGLVRQISPDEVEITTEQRVVKYRAKLQRITLADNLDLARATGGKVALA